MRSAVPLLALAALLAGSVAPAAEPTAEDYLNFLRPVVGQWNVTVRIGDQTAETTFSARPSPTKRSIVSSGGKVFQYPAFDAIEGYDASAKKWKWTAFVSDGGHTVAYSTADAAELKGNEATFHIESTASTQTAPPISGKASLPSPRPKTSGSSPSTTSGSMERSNPTRSGCTCGP